MTSSSLSEPSVAVVWMVDPRAKEVNLATAIHRALTVWSLRRRASRSEFWLYVALWFPLALLFWFIAGVAHSTIVTISLAPFELGLTIIGLKVAACRYHDIGRSGWWLGLQGAMWLTSWCASLASLLFGVGVMVKEAFGHRVPTDMVPIAVACALVGIGLALSSFTWSLVWLVTPGKPMQNQWNAESPDNSHTRSSDAEFASSTRRAPDRPS